MEPLTGREGVPQLVVVLVKPSRAFQRGVPLPRAIRRLWCGSRHMVVPVKGRQNPPNANPFSRTSRLVANGKTTREAGHEVGQDTWGSSQATDLRATTA
ncbi:hypothetical protein KY290_013427 [Solanum tuberosum]|uniref:Uncharacterized protein n=1 Tax=Solanum tuberosum TaxID=4113 RepID=A0ABQ7VLM6_SOLTU|nr:hypothetical protein KY285_012889 [Solanum tuberosum]KAH0769446.1 hypothetical protein KY290_013427 [Solanum tuberosum]